MRPTLLLTTILLAPPTLAHSQEAGGAARAPGPTSGARVPGATWQRYADVAEAGFDPEKLAAAHAAWKDLPSSAFVVVSGGAVVAAWGDVERRFMCHSVRKSFLSALYGIYWDKGELELNKTLADLGLDDAPESLLETEKRARILDLLKARSGVFHPAAYAGRTDSRPRGSEGPGRFFAYNNWDFNTLAHILREETGADVFEAFDQHFARPLGMQDYRVSDGYYHYERDKSIYPAYPFRMSARDAARFGLLFTRLGDWGGERVLSRHWVRRSTALYSIDSELMGYGFMWWVFLPPHLEQHGMVAALGVGNQMIAALPDSDLVIVNRANTYEGENTPMGGLQALITQVLEARTGAPVDEPRLVAMEAQPRDARMTQVPVAALEPFVGTFPYPPAPLGQPQEGQVDLSVDGEQLIARVDNRGTFALHLQPDGTFVEEDSFATYFAVRGDETGFAFGNGPGARELPFAGLARRYDVVNGALLAASKGRAEAAQASLLALALPATEAKLTECMVAALQGDFEVAAEGARALAPQFERGEVESRINGAGYALLGARQPEGALRLFELNTAVFPRSSNAWDSLAEAHVNLGNPDDAVHFYEMSLDLDPDNENAQRMIARIRGSGARDE